MNYKFKIGNTVPSDEKIDKHKDFKKLKANYDKQVAPLYKKPLYKDPKALIVVLIILLLTYILVEVYQKEEGEGHKMEQQDTKIGKPSVVQPSGGEGSVAKDSNTYPHATKLQADSIKKIDIKK